MKNKENLDKSPKRYIVRPLPTRLPVGAGEQKGFILPGAGLPDLAPKINEIIDYLETILVSSPNQSKDH